VGRLFAFTIGLRFNRDREMTLVYDIWSVLAARQRRWVIGAQVLSIVMAFSTVIGIASIAPFFSLLGDPKLIDQTGLLHWLYHLGFSSSRSFTVALGLAFMGLVILANLINVIGSFVMIRLALWISTDLQSILFEEYLHRPYIFHARTPSAVLFNNIIHETIRATNQILQNAFLLITNIVTALFIIVSVMLLNPVVAAAMIGALAGGYVLIYLAVRNRLLQAGRTQSQLFVELTKTVNESLGAIKEILVLRTQQYFRASFARSSEEFARAAAHTQLIAQSPRYVMECVAVVGLVAAALLASGRDQGIGPWLGQLTFLGFAAYRLLPTLQQAFVAIVRIRADRPGFTAIARDLRLARARKYAVAAPDSPWRESPRSEIRLEEVSFRYEPERPLAVDGVSLRIPVRAAIGLVGANGSGKTTLVDLIAGLLVPAQGHIEVDGIVLNEGNRAAWQARIAYVPQNIFLLDTSIAQNVALGIAAADIDRKRLLAAAQLAQLDEFVATLPGGYDHMVGERGVKLSGGQRQRIGIARALYADASVLILDEATNALDGLTEQEMMATIVRLRGRYTIIVIAHRLSTVRACDAIVEFDHGKVTASGTYEGLLRNSETFRRLANVS
jgi:ABC-type multidrug transport system fused ATPase/permease subunit